MFHACLKGCSRIFNRFFLGCFKEFSRVIKVSRKFLGVCQEHFNGDSRRFSGCFRSVFRMVEGGSKKVSMKFQGSFPRVSRKFLGASW